MIDILTHPTYSQLDDMCVSIIKQIRAANIKPDLILGVSRGGLIPAVIISHLMDVPMKCVHYSSKEGAGDNKNHSNELPDVHAKQILIVDDICDSGKTLEEMFAHYIQKHSTHTVALYYKELDKGGYVPDFYSQKIPADAPWIIFPFEKEAGEIDEEE